MTGQADMLRLRQSLLGQLLLAVLSGVLYGLAFPPFGLWLAFAALAPLYLALPVHGRWTRLALLGAVTALARAGHRRRPPPLAR